MARSYLCVGGPKAGQRVALKEGMAYFRVALPPASYSPEPGQPVEIRYVEYREQTVFAPRENFSFWAPSDQTVKQSMELLLESYEIYRTRREP
jgi:hypothetical protein